MSPDVLSRTFSALSDPTRRRLLGALEGGQELTVGELAAPFPVSFQAIAKHVQVLEEAGLVVGVREGRTKRLRLAPDGTALLASWLEDHRRRADARYRRLDVLLAALPDVPPPDDPSSPTHP